jgi:alkanesulfonate monooxygenase SsuD/methylene tetrahydromethanopterin reductase-like flavin-dependent oxidoreductase (luciferase family)
MAAIAAYAADTDAQALRLFTSLQQSFVNLRRGTPGPLPPPVDSMEGRWSDFERAGVTQAFREAIVGSPATVKRGIAEFVPQQRGSTSSWSRPPSSGTRPASGRSRSSRSPAAPD